MKQEVRTLVTTENPQSRVEAEARTFGEIAQFALQYEIRNQADYDYAAEVLQEITRREKALDLVKQEVTKPLMQGLDAVRAWFKPAEGHASLARKELKAKIAAYHNHSRVLVQRAAEQMKEATANGDHAAIARHHSNLRPVEKVAGLQVREVWDCEITEFAIVPREFLIVDMSAVRRHMSTSRKADGVPLEIAGIRFFKRPVIASVG